MKYSACLGWMLAVVVLPASTALGGVWVTNEVIGTVTDGVDAAGSLGFGANFDLTGQQVRLNFRYDTGSAPADSEGDPTLGIFSSVSPPDWFQLAHVSIAGIELPRSNFPSVFDEQQVVVDDALGAIEFTQFDDTVNGVVGTFEELSVILEGAQPGVFGTDSLPTAIEFSDFASGLGFYGMTGANFSSFVDVSVEFSVDSVVSQSQVVPEPTSSLAWLSLSIAALLARRKFVRHAASAITGF